MRLGEEKYAAKRIATESIKMAIIVILCCFRLLADIAKKLQTTIATRTARKWYHGRGISAPGFQVNRIAAIAKARIQPAALMVHPGSTGEILSAVRERETK